jgi:hypothetical protein
MTLHWAKKVMVKVWDVYGLIDNQVERPPDLWIIIGNYTTHSLIGFTSEVLIIAHNGDRSIKVQNDKASHPNTQVSACESSSRVVS